MLALFHAARATIKKTAAHGVALVSVTDAWMSGRGAYYVEMIAKHGLVAIHSLQFAAGGPARRLTAGARHQPDCDCGSFVARANRTRYGHLSLHDDRGDVTRTAWRVTSRRRRARPRGRADEGPNGGTTRRLAAIRRLQRFRSCADDAGAGTARRFWLGCRERLRLSLCHLPTRPLWASRHIRAPGDAADRAHQDNATAARRRRHPYSVRAGISLPRACTPRGLGDRPGGIRCAHSTARAVTSAPTCGFQKFHPVGFARPGRIRSRPRTRVPGMALSAGGLLRSHREHRRAHGLAGLQVAMRLCGVFQRIGLLDLDLDRTREHHSEEILCHRREIGTGGSVGV